MGDLVTPPMWLRRILRPLIPDTVMAKVRLAQHSQQSRTNVEVLEADARRRRAWLARTPDTYRVHRDGAAIPPTWIRSGETSAARVAGDVRAVVVADADPPRLRNRRRTEPVLGVRGVAYDPDVLTAVPCLAETDDLVAAVESLRTAGEAYALVALPVGEEVAPTVRTALIDAELCVVILALVPMHDVGGGSRGAQLARSFAAEGAHVTYVSLYGTQESTDLGLRYLHPSLEQRDAGAFEPDDLLARVPDGVNVLVVLEAPHPSYEQAFDRLRAGGATTVYDLIDDWRAASLGGEWYRPEVEDRIARTATALIASAPDLVGHLATRTGRDVTLVPNAVDTALFDPTQAYERPTDLPAGPGSVLLYHGSLYGDWFDWIAVAAVAHANPAAAVVLIGDVPTSVPDLPSNVTLLGLKAQTELPAYLAHADVGLIPFTVTDVTHAVSPLKAYEYLAMGLPVAGPPLRALDGLAGVTTDVDLAAAVGICLGAPSQNTTSGLGWEHRVRAITEAGNVPLPAGSEHSVQVERRVATHHDRRARRVLG